MHRSFGMAHHRNVSAAIVFLSFALSACRSDAPDAYGAFEATEIVISAEFPGRLINVNAAEGEGVRAGDMLALIDTSAFALQRAELIARRAAVEARIREISAQENVIEVQRSIAQQEYERTVRLAAKSAATAQQLDRATRDLRTLEAQGRVHEASRVAITKEMATVDAQIARLNDKAGRHAVTTPRSATVVARYVEPGELAQPGTPLFRLASLDTMIFRAYVSEAQLSKVRLADIVTVGIDAPEHSLRHLQGRVTWISPTAEFTPTPIQTREERVTQVYAVKIAVANSDRSLRIGMPGELLLSVDSMRVSGAATPTDVHTALGKLH